MSRVITVTVTPVDISAEEADRRAVECEQMALALEAGGDPIGAGGALDMAERYRNKAFRARTGFPSDLDIALALRD